MARSITWRRRCPGDVAVRAELAQRATLYIVHQSGPTAFLVQEESGKEQKAKVLLGDRHCCSCPSFRREKELCLHILWVLIKKFRIPRENPISWQLGLVEREINEVLRGVIRRQPADHSDKSSTLDEPCSKTSPKPIDTDDVCPICQERLLGRKSLPLTFCKFGCGNNIHIKCMKIWAKHQHCSNGSDDRIHCPLCRENFGTYKELCSQFHSPSTHRLLVQCSAPHLGVTCSHCHVCPIQGRCFCCCTCASYYLCQACFSTNQYHVSHPFQFRQHPNQPWRPATRAPNPPASSVLPHGTLSPTIISSLQSRSLTESDYELLLALDQPYLPDAGHTAGPSPRLIPDRIINSFHVEPVSSSHPLLLSGAVCSLCSQPYSRGDWLRKLLCRHKFHRDCIDQWFRSGQSVCPVDSQPVCHTAARRAGGRRKQTAVPANLPPNGGNHKSRMATGPSITRALSKRLGVVPHSNEEISVSGHSIGHADKCGGCKAHISRSLAAAGSRRTSSPTHPDSTATGSGLPPQLSSGGRVWGSVGWGGCEGTGSQQFAAVSSASSPHQFGGEGPRGSKGRPLEHSSGFNLSPVCSSYHCTALASLEHVGGASSLPTLAPAHPQSCKSSMTSASSRPHKSSRKLDSRLSVARFKLHPLPANTSLVIQS